MTDFAWNGFWYQKTGWFAFMCRGNQSQFFTSSATHYLKCKSSALCQTVLLITLLKEWLQDCDWGVTAKSRVSLFRPSLTPWLKTCSHKIKLPQFQCLLFDKKVLCLVWNHFHRKIPKVLMTCLDRNPSLENFRVQLTAKILWNALAGCSSCSINIEKLTQ